MNSSVEATPVGKRILAAAPSRGQGGDDAEPEPRDAIKTPADADPSRGKALQEQVGRLEDEIDFLSHKLKEEETARKAAEREAHGLRKELKAAKNEPPREKERGAAAPEDKGYDVAALRSQVADLQEQLADREASLKNALKRLETFRPAADSQSDAAGTKDKDVESLTTDNRLLNEELDRMSAELGKLQQRLARGEYNPARSRVVKPTMTAPCAKCVEVAALREKVASLEAAMAEALANASSNSKAGDESGCGEALELGLKIAEMNKTIAEKDKYIARLSEQAKTQIQEYKEVAKALFGFSLSKYKTADAKAVAGQYQVQSLFACYIHTHTHTHTHTHVYSYRSRACLHARAATCCWCRRRTAASKSISSPALTSRA